MNSLKNGSLIFATALTLSISTAWADQESFSKELATMFRSARKGISDNQDLINDASKGDKGLNSAKVLELMKSNYKDATKQDLKMSGEAAAAKDALVAAIKAVMDEAQPLINEQGKAFKGFLPAVFGGRVANKFSASMEGKVRIKLTAPREYVRNRANRPDDWESKVIEEMFRNAAYERGKAFAEAGQVDGKAAYRYILPEYYGESCLKCHGDPKGEIDITGGKKEGAKLNDLGGAISVVVFN